MQELFHQLGIDWKLLISQAVNFGLLLIVLRIFAYKPLLALMQERRERIEAGLAKADEADQRLKDVQDEVKGRIREAEAEGLTILRKTEEQAKILETQLTEGAHRKEQALMREAEAKAQAKEAEAEAAFKREAADLVRQAIIRTVELSPASVDDSLIKKAVAELKTTRRAK